jgi:PHD/YefM family antitoxin component YafN of YafNO toxin-antitoxin module
LIDEAASVRSLFIVTRMGRPRVVVLEVDQYRELIEEIETAEELGDIEYLVGITEARDDRQLGRILTLEELDHELGFTEEELTAKPY